MIIEKVILMLIGTSLGLLSIFGVCFYCKMTDGSHESFNKKQWFATILFGGPFIWCGYLVMLYIFLFVYIFELFNFIPRFINWFVKVYLSDIETKRVKCPYCDLEPLQSTIRRYGMCGLCHSHGKGYNYKRIK